jgi:oxalate decarboxylase
VYRTFQHAPELAPGGAGQWWKIDSTKFPVAKTIASTYVVIEPKGIRELHWHPTVCRSNHVWESDRGDTNAHAVRGMAVLPLRRSAGNCLYWTLQLAHFRLQGWRHRCVPRQCGYIFFSNSFYVRELADTCCAGHYIENTSATQNLTFIEIYKSERVADVSLTQWLALTPAEIVSSVLKIPVDVVQTLKKEKQVFVQGQ